jgi:hypothetical protein
VVADFIRGKIDNVAFREACADAEARLVVNAAVLVVCASDYGVLEALAMEEHGGEYVVVLFMG